MRSSADSRCSSGRQPRRLGYRSVRASLATSSEAFAGALASWQQLHKDRRLTPMRVAQSGNVGMSRDAATTRAAAHAHRSVAPRIAGSHSSHSPVVVTNCAEDVSHMLRVLHDGPILGDYFKLAVAFVARLWFHGLQALSHPVVALFHVAPLLGTWPTPRHVVIPARVAPGVAVIVSLAAAIRRVDGRPLAARATVLPVDVQPVSISEPNRVARYVSASVHFCLDAQGNGQGILAQPIAPSQAPTRANASPENGWERCPVKPTVVTSVPAATVLCPQGSNA